MSRPVNRPDTYGELQDAAAGALARLLAAEVPTTQVEIDTIHACQAMIRTALVDRLRLLGAEPRSNAKHTSPMLRLAQLVDQLPGRDAFVDEALSPLDALQPYAPDVLGQTAKWWQTAASSTMLATEALAGDQGLQPLLTRNEAAWRLTTDVASTLEAIAVLDQDLVACGALPGRTPDLDGLDTLRRETSYIARMGDWYGPDASLDLATRSAGGTDSSWQVHLVKTKDDLEPAQRRLGDFLAFKARSADQPRLTRSEALAMTTTQLRFAAHLAETSRATLGDGDKTTQRLVLLREDLQSLHNHLGLLRDVVPAAPRMNVMGQLTELSNGITRAHGRGELADLSPAQLDALAQTSRWACGRYAETLAYETTRKTGKLRFARVRATDRAFITTREPARAALRRLAHDAPAVPGPSSRLPDSTSARAQLRGALDRTPTARPPQTPSPTTGRDFGR
jgi:hypothetical protein